MDLADVRLTDAGLAQIAKVRGLKQLSFSAADISDTGFKRVNRLRGLEELDVRDAKITAAALASLADMPHLTTLDVDGEEFTYGNWAHAAVPYLVNLKTLTTLYLDGLNDADLKKLHARLPNCGISMSHGRMHGGMYHGEVGF